MTNVILEVDFSNGSNGSYWASYDALQNWYYFTDLIEYRVGFADPAQEEGEPERQETLSKRYGSWYRSTLIKNISIYKTDIQNTANTVINHTKQITELQQTIIEQQTEITNLQQTITNLTETVNNNYTTLNNKIDNSVTTINNKINQLEIDLKADIDLKLQGYLTINSFNTQIANYVTLSYLQQNYYTANYIYSNYYTGLYIRNNYYTQKYIQDNYYTDVYITNNYLTKTNIENNYYSKLQVQQNYLTIVNAQNTYLALSVYNTFITNVYNYNIDIEIDFCINTPAGELLDAAINYVFSVLKIQGITGAFIPLIPPKVYNSRFYGNYRSGGGTTRGGGASRRGSISRQ